MRDKIRSRRCYVGPFVGLDLTGGRQMNGQSCKLLKMRDFRSRTGALLDRRIATLQSLRVRNM